MVAERAEVLGGTTAWSGGWMWLPRNSLARDAGIAEDISAPRSYLEAVLGDRFDPARIDAFLAAAPEMVAFLIEQGMRFEAGNAICDIYAGRPGAGTGGRSLIAAPLRGRELGKRIALLRETKRETALLGMPIQAELTSARSFMPPGGPARRCMWRAGSPGICATSRRMAARCSCAMAPRWWHGCSSLENSAACAG